VVLVLAAGLTAGAWALLRPGDGAEAAQCAGTVTLRVTAAPDIAATVTDLATAYNGTSPRAGTRCVEVAVKTAPSAAVAADIVGNSGILPNVWIPDSSIWAEQVTIGTQQAQAQAVSSDLPPVKVSVSGTLASSPLVVVAPRATAEAIGGGSQSFSWASVLQGQVPATVSDPSTTSEGLTAALTLNKLFGGEQTRQQLTSTLLTVVRTAVPSVQVAYEAFAADPAAAPLFPASEQSVVAHNRRDPTTPVSALYPSEGTFGFDFPTVRVTTNETPTSLDQAAEAFEAALASPDSVAALQRAGFRSPEGEATGFTPELGVLPTAPTSLGQPRLSEASALLSALDALRRDSKMLAVFDVSGSMQEREPNGSTRIELARDAAKTALGLFSDTYEVGLWAFSIDQTPTQDWEEIVPTRPMNAAVGDDSQVQLLIEGVEALPERTGGGTGLHDTILAAYRAAKEGYDPAKVNSVVLLTDGRNDDEDGIDLPTLLDSLRAEVDPAKPVVLVTIGVGPDADLEVLQQVSELTGAKAYAAADPSQIQSVFLDALGARSGG
jgi:Mg-chelatase subunit ChlD